MKKISINSKTHFEILIAILETSPSGMTIGEVRQSFKLIDKLQSTPEDLVLTEAEYNMLIDRFNSAKFSRVTKELVDLADILESAITEK
jgi:hypothetical protein